MELISRKTKQIDDMREEVKNLNMEIKRLIEEVSSLKTISASQMQLDIFGDDIKQE
jgi:archaellum component FlaC